MGIDFVERFFKLTLDNVYRFSCSFIFVAAIAGSLMHAAPTAVIAKALSWLGVPSGWLGIVGEWIAARDIAIGWVSALVLTVALAFAATNGPNSRAGATALLSTALLYEVGRGPWLLTLAVWLLVGWVVFSASVQLITRRLQWGSPQWIIAVWEKIGLVSASVMIAFIYVASPLGWLISQEALDRRGSASRPLYVTRIAPHGPSGARIR